jgi:hypothetical protein
MPAMHAKRKDQPAELTAGELIVALGKLSVAGHDLKALIEVTNGHITTDFERRVAIMKQSRDGKGLPIQFLEHQLHQGQCRCVSAMNWLQGD